MATGDIRPGYTGEYHPEIFTTVPPPVAQKKPGQLESEKIREYFEKGYIIVEDFFDKNLLEKCREAVANHVEDLAQRLHNAGKIKNLYEEYGFFQRLTKIEEDFPGAAILLLKTDILPQAMRNLWTDEKLLNVVEQLIGPDIVGHPVWNLRTKVPQNEATTVPWHQDSGYFDIPSYEVLIPTAWIPLLDATEQNGCMQVAEGGHRKGLVATHECCAGGTFYVMLQDEEMADTLGVDLKNDIKTCEVPYGGMLLINNLIPHRSLPNCSNEIRWSLDLRWQSALKPVGFFGITGAVPFRKADDPDYKIDWEKHLTSRHIQQRQSVEDITGPQEDEFDTILTGPWMKKWKITHSNRHTDKVTTELEAAKAKTKA